MGIGPLTAMHRLTIPCAILCGACLQSPISAEEQKPASFVTTHNGTYGYTGALPKQESGELPPPMAMIFIRYLGNTDGLYKFQWNNGAGKTVEETCRAPCAMVQESQYTGDKLDFTSSRTFPAETGIGQAIQDALAGRLTPYQTSHELASTAQPKPKVHDRILEPDAILYDDSPESIKLIHQLVNLVRANDFRCDTVSAARPMILSRGYVLSCNQLAYSYDIADK